MKGKIRSATAYPLFVLFVAIVVVIVLMAKVIPTFLVIFDEFDADLPGITKSLIWISNFFQRYWMIMLAVVAAIVLGLKIYGNTEEGRLKLAQFRLKLPIIGNIAELTAASEFANTMATMLGAGLPLTRCISITAKVLSNYHISQETGKLTGKLEQGYPLAQSMQEADIMPEILTDMVGVGEETGEMEKTLKTIAGYYDTELDMAVQSALAKLEPALLIGMAVIAGYIVIAVYIAMFSMYAAM
jgi:type IV pilus assembly protein PilC